MAKIIRGYIRDIPGGTGLDGQTVYLKTYNPSVSLASTETNNGLYEFDLSSITNGLNPGPVYVECTYNGQTKVKSGREVHQEGMWFSTDFQDQAKAYGDGVFSNSDFTLTNDSSTLTNIGAGTALVDGCVFRLVSTYQLALNTTLPTAGKSRIDRIYLRQYRVNHDTSPGKQDFVSVTGIAATSPSVPTGLVSDGQYRYLEIGRVTVNSAGATTADATFVPNLLSPTMGDLTAYNLTIDNRVLSDIIFSTAADRAIKIADRADNTGRTLTVAAGGATGTNRAGGGLVVSSGTGSGTGTVSTITFNTPTVTTSGSSAQSSDTRLTISSASISMQAELPFYPGGDILINGAGSRFLRLGSVNGAAGNTLTVQAANGYGTDMAGGDLYLAGGQATGNSTPGKVYIQTSIPSVTSGGGIRSLATRITVDSTTTTIANNLAASGTLVVTGVTALNNSTDVNSTATTAFRVRNGDGSTTVVSVNTSTANLTVNGTVSANGNTTITSNTSSALVVGDGSSNYFVVQPSAKVVDVRNGATFKVFSSSGTGEKGSWDSSTGAITTAGATTINNVLTVGSTSTPAFIVQTAGGAPMMQVDTTDAASRKLKLFSGTDINLYSDAGTTLKASISADTGAIDSRGALTADGAAVLGSTLAVTGATTLSSTLVVTGASTFDGNVTIGDAAADILSINAGKIRSLGNVPTLTPNAKLGSTGTSTNRAANTNLAGVITLTPGGTGITFGTQVTVAFSDSVTLSGNQVVFLTPQNTAAASIAGQFYISATGTTSWSLASTVALTSGTAYDIGYLVIDIV